MPRTRPRISIAESQLDLAGLQRRATWQRNFAFGQSTEADITVKGWRQPDGTLWRTNQLVSVSSRPLGVDQDLLVAGVQFNLSNGGGRTTALRLGPIEGYTPDPGQVKLRKHKGSSQSGINWTGAGQ